MAEAQRNQTKANDHLANNRAHNQRMTPIISRTTRPRTALHNPGCRPSANSMNAVTNSMPVPGPEPKVPRIATSSCVARTESSKKVSGEHTTQIDNDTWRVESVAKQPRSLNQPTQIEHIMMYNDRGRRIHANPMRYVHTDASMARSTSKFHANVKPQGCNQRLASHRSQLYGGPHVLDKGSGKRA